MTRSYYSQNLENFFTDNTDFILGKLTKNHQFALEEQQRNAWIKQIDILKNELNGLGVGRILFEYSIPRMGKRVDVILIYSGFVFVIEFKVNETQYNNADIEQCLDYVLDLKNFAGPIRNLVFPAKTLVETRELRSSCQFQHRLYVIHPQIFFFCT